MKKEKEREREGKKKKSEKEKRKKKEIYFYGEGCLYFFLVTERQFEWFLLAPCGDKARLKTMQEALSIIVYLFCFYA